MIDKERLGRNTWHVLNLLASNYVSEASIPADRSLYWELLDLITVVYPCIECRDHVRALVLENKIDDSIEFPRAVYRLHDLVSRDINRRLSARSSATALSAPRRALISEQFFYDILREVQRTADYSYVAAVWYVAVEIVAENTSGKSAECVRMSNRFVEIMLYLAFHISFSATREYKYDITLLKQISFPRD